MENHLSSRFSNDDGQRQEYMDRCRLCASLSDPNILPPQNTPPGSQLPTNFQSLGSRGLNSTEGKLLTALYGGPWFRYFPAPAIRYGGNVATETLQEIEQRLYMRELTILGVLESSYVKRRDINAFDAAPRTKASFKSRKRLAIGQLLACGDVLEQLTDSYQTKVFRLDQYTTFRDSCGDVVYHTIRERIDGKSLSMPLQEEAGIVDRMASDVAKDRMVELYTGVDWQPQTRTWVIKQEVNGKQITESQEPVTPFFSTPYKLTGGEHYGRGFIESLLGDLLSYDKLRERLLDFAYACSDFKIVKDYSSNIRDKDLLKPSGNVMRGRVAGGQVQDLAYMRVDKLNDFNACAQAMEAIRRDLASAMLLESETAPTGERVTAYQISRIAKELEDASGGAYSNIADYQQVPLLERVVYQMERDKIIPKLEGDYASAEVVTGIAALEANDRINSILNMAQIMASLGQEALRWIDMGVMAQVVARYSRIREPGLVKTPEQLKKEQEAAIAQANQAYAQQAAIDTLGTAAQKGIVANG